jgi:DUF4097 and DUF4098 domain-containing protein YvlB
LGAALLGLTFFASPAAVSAETRIERRLEMSAGGTFRLDTDAGSVRIVGGASDAAEIVLTSRRDDVEENYTLSFESSGGDATVRVERKGSVLRHWFRSESMHFEIRLPRQADVDVDTAGGAIELEQIDGEVELKTSGGAIEAEQVVGLLIADTSGGAIRVSRVDGEVRADTSGGGITVTEVTGPVVADTSGGGIAMSDIGGDIVADTSGGSIAIDGAGGSVEAETSGGPVTVSFAPGNAAGGSLSSSGGRVTAAVDPSVGLDIDASTSGGSVVSDLPLTIRGAVSKSELRGQLNGGGATLRLRSSGGGIRLESN